MRYRTLSPTGDYVFGQGLGEFLVNTPEAVAQAVQTRLRLAQGEWFLDKLEGTPYATQILGHGTLDIYDQAIKERILETTGVTALISYASVLDADRKLTVSCEIETLYGTAQITEAF